MLLLWTLSAALAWTPVAGVEPKPNAVEVTAGLPLAPGKPPPRIVVTCAAARWSVRFDPGVMAAYNGFGDAWEETYAAVAYAFDGDTPRSGKLRRGTADEGLWWPKPKKALRTFEQHRSLDLYFTAVGQSAPTKLSFDIDGLAAARAAMPACLP